MVNAPYTKPFQMEPGWSWAVIGWYTCQSESNIYSENLPSDRCQKKVNDLWRDELVVSKLLRLCTCRDKLGVSPFTSIQSEFPWSSNSQTVDELHLNTLQFWHSSRAFWLVRTPTEAARALTNQQPQVKDITLTSYKLYVCSLLCSRLMFLN